MATVKLSIGQVNITNYMLVILRYTDSPGAEIERKIIDPDDIEDVNNLTFNNVQPKPCFVDVRESLDGEDLGTLLSTFQIDVNEKINVIERRFYTIGGMGENDPADGSTELTDDYFEGKIVSGLFQQGFRHLKEMKPGDVFNGHEWKRVDNTLQLLNPETGNMDGPVFNAGEVYVVDISYLQDVINGDSTEPALIFADITESVNLTSANRRKANMIEAATTKVIITLEPLSTLVDGEWYKFITNSGSQKQVVIQRSGSDVIRFNNSNKTRLVLGTSEFLLIAKKGSRFEVIDSHENLQKVGQKFTGMSNSYMNAMLYDATLRDGDEYPRVWDFIMSLPANFAVNDPNIANVGWAPSSGKDCCWHYYDSGPNKYFRCPNTQNTFSRPLKSFSSRGADSNRLFDYPGGIQTEMVGPHIHYSIVNTDLINGDHPENIGRDVTANSSPIKKYNKNTGQGKESYTLASSTSKPTVGKTSPAYMDEFMVIEGTETRARNYGEFEFVCI